MVWMIYESVDVQCKLDKHPYGVLPEFAYVHMKHLLN